MTAREPYKCLTCNRAMVLRRTIPSRQGQQDITVWGCLECSEKQEAALAENVAQVSKAAKRLPISKLA